MLVRDDLRLILEDAGFVERALEAGAVAHVLKPFHVANIVGAVTAALAGRSPHVDPEAARRHQLIMIESMVRSGYSEREITETVDSDSTGRRRAVPRAGLLGRLRGLLGR